MRKKELFDFVLDYFQRERADVAVDAADAPDTRVDTELHYGTDFQLLVAVMLSAQCTDRRINMVTPALFADYPDAATMAEASAEVIYEYIKSVSYPNNKARHLVGMARALVQHHGGEVPRTLAELTQLPGVGRKTANVILAVAFGQPALAVDTHVFRVSHRLGLVPKSATTPYAVEVALRRYIPDALVARGHYWLLLHGRYVCTARSPKCTACGLAEVCTTAKAAAGNAGKESR